MITSPEVYPQNESISIVFLKEDSLEARLLRAFRDAFGNDYAILEHLDAHYCCLHLRGGKLREVRQ
jgi:hypothetical protein